MRHEPIERGGGAKRRRAAACLEAALVRLEVLDANDLAAAWMERFGAPPPSALPTRLVVLALAHDLQAAALGGLDPARERRLARSAAVVAQSGPSRSPALRLKPGATLLRDWGGRTWRVEVEADGGFAFDGRRWRSLSAIAREITGASRNGPAFFGLRGGGDGAP